eukprot:5716166-Lingulodinium_polyedra.AAC.1
MPLHMMTARGNTSRPGCADDDTHMMQTTMNAHLKVRVQTGQPGATVQPTSTTKLRTRWQHLRVNSSSCHKTVLQVYNTNSKSHSLLAHAMPRMRAGWML